VWQRQAEAVYVARQTGEKELIVDDHCLRPELRHVASEGDDGLDDRLHTAYARASPR